MKNIILGLISIFLLSSCNGIKDIDFKGVEGFKFGKIEGKKLSFNLNVKIENPNAFSITIKPSNVDLFVEDQLLGKAFLNEKVKLIRNNEDIYSFPIHLDLEDGAMIKFFKYALKDKVSVRIKGKAKGSAFGISKKVMIDEVKELDGSFFKLDKLLGK